MEGWKKGMSMKLLMSTMVLLIFEFNIFGEINRASSCGKCNPSRCWFEKVINPDCGFDNGSVETLVNYEM